MNNSIKKGVVVAVILLFVSVSVIPSTGTNVVEKSSTVSFDGDILYVGGSGPNNYTKIQDAIDNTSDGDTVFVYSGFYQEGIINVNNSINIIGEDKNTTIVDGYGTWCVFFFQYGGKSNCKLSGFTIQNAKTYGGAGVHLYSSNHTIYGNIIQNNRCKGIILAYSSYNHIYDNIFKNNGFNSYTSLAGGISIFASHHNIIERNTFDNNFRGILVWRGDHNSISRNVIINSSNQGVYLDDTEENEIISNHIINNNIGVRLVDTQLTLVKKNNIYNNSKNGSFVRVISSFFYFRKSLTRWMKNYWGDITSPFKIINGEVHIPVGYNLQGLVYKSIKWINFDWRPALEPYDIGGVIENEPQDTPR